MSGLIDEKLLEVPPDVRDPERRVVELVDGLVTVRDRPTSRLHESVQDVFILAVHFRFRHQPEVGFKPISGPDVAYAVHDLFARAPRFLQTELVARHPDDVHAPRVPLL